MHVIATPPQHVSFTPWLTRPATGTEFAVMGSSFQNFTKPARQRGDRLLFPRWCQGQEQTWFTAKGSALSQITDDDKTSPGLRLWTGPNA